MHLNPASLVRAVIVTMLNVIDEFNEAVKQVFEYLRELFDRCMLPYA